MSRAVEVADLDAAKSSLRVIARNDGIYLEATNFSILYRNFSGKDNNGYNKDHVRSFNLMLTPEQIIYLSEVEREYSVSFNIRSKLVFTPEEVARGAEQREAKFINVKVNYQPEHPERHPRIELYTPDRNNLEKNDEGKYKHLNKTSLNESSVDLLDTTVIERWDAMLKLYSSGNRNRYEGTGIRKVTLYLSKLKAIAEYQEEFGAYYDDFDGKSADIETASEVAERMYDVNPATGE